MHPQQDPGTLACVYGKRVSQGRLLNNNTSLEFWHELFFFYFRYGWCSDMSFFFFFFFFFFFILSIWLMFWHELFFFFFFFFFYFRYDWCFLFSLFKFLHGNNIQRFWNVHLQNFPNSIYFVVIFLINLTKKYQSYQVNKNCTFKQNMLMSLPYMSFKQIIA